MADQETPSEGHPLPQVAVKGASGRKAALLPKRAEGGNRGLAAQASELKAGAADVTQMSVAPGECSGVVETAASDFAVAPDILKTDFSFKDPIMDMSANFSGFQGVMSEAQAKAKEAFEKSTNLLGEVGEFTKGNVEAVIESGRILADGCQDLGTALITEGRTAFEAMTADVKELAGAKTPADFFKVQSELARKSFDNAVSYGAKNSEAMLKLMSDAMAPISGRMSVAVEKARQTAMPSAGF